MYRVSVERVINKPIEDVFERIVDHENYVAFPGVKASRLLEQGHSEKNGVGALRFIDAGKMQLKERIVDFERPTRMRYHIESSTPFFIALKIGQVSLYETDQGTHVRWISEGHITIPVIGHLMDRLFEKQFSRAFGSILKSIDKH